MMPSNGTTNWKPALTVLFVTAWLTNTLLHVPSFSRDEFRGDENVYLYLASTMGWDQSNYSTAESPAFSTWPVSIYQQPLFHHPPLFPYVIKVGQAFGQPIVSAFLFANLLMALLFVHLAMLYKRLDLEPCWRAVGYFSLALGPLLLFSTTRIHMDGLLGVALACGVVTYIEAIERRSLVMAAICGLWFSMALNLNYSALVALPLLVLLHGYSLYRSGNWRGPAEWKMFAIVVLLVAVVGLGHYYRIISVYRSIWPWDFMVADTTDAFVQWKMTRTRLGNVLNLVLLVPLLLVFLMPAAWKSLGRGSAERNWGAAVVGGFALVLAGMIAVSYGEMRYFAVAMPLFYAGFPWLLRYQRAARYPLFAGWLLLSLCLMLMAGYREVVVRPDEGYLIVPALYELIPPMKTLW